MQRKEATPWHRMRFYVPNDDCAVTSRLPDGPWWISGETGDGEQMIIVAFTKDPASIAKTFPGADNIEPSGEPKEVIEFFDRFPCPKWWDAEAEEIRPEWRR